jgi:GT2 family glycosyltransferase
MLAEPRPASTEARAEFACWLGDGVLAVAGWCADGPGAGDDGNTGGIHLPPPSTDGPAHLAVRSIVFARDETGEAATGFLAVATGVPSLAPAVLDLDVRCAVLDPARVEVTDAESLAWFGLAGVGADARLRAMDLLAATMDDVTPGFAAGRLAVELRRFRDAVRIRRPHCQIAVDVAQGLFIDAVHRVDDRSFYVRGWMRDAADEITGLAALSPEGSRVELASTLAHFPRPDVEQFYGAPSEEQGMARPGFVAHIELPAPSVLPDGWVFELHNAGGVAVEAVAPTVADDAGLTRSVVLADLSHETPGEDVLVRDHTFPALRKLGARHHWSGAITSVTQYGTPPADPVTSVIVPLYRRIDFVEHQLAHFVDDPDLPRTDLIYVLDSPEMAVELAATAAALHRLYGVPFRTVVLRRNLGFADANNAGVSAARGRLLLLLNSDVIPDRPGWLSTMVDFLDATPAAGAVGPKLVYEDGSIQHAGMYFLRPEGSPWWENAHYHKGLHRSFPGAAQTRVVPALTGACLLLTRELWDKVGGLSGTYVQGDYEDSDLCLRIGELGYDCWYLPAAELYHLEGQSYPTPLRRLTSRFNTWLHTHLWDARITELMQAASGPPAPPAPAVTARSRTRTRTPTRPSKDVKS